MPARIADWCTEHDAPVPAGRPALIRSIVESLAVAFVRAVNQAAELSGRRVDVIHVVGGGAQNRLLCQAIADRSGRPVIAGPVEATALGNVLVQARAAGATLAAFKFGGFRLSWAGCRRCRWVAGAGWSSPACWPRPW